MPPVTLISSMRNWLLPENIEDILPPEAQRIEALRARLLELYRVHGYRLVMPPLLEYLESLLTGTGEDLDLRTFKFVDQLSGRMMGIRADITPQVARIDAHLLNQNGITRLCYCGSILHTQLRTQTATREPLQIGAEIFGHAGIESDLEIQSLLLKSLTICGVKDARLDIGHVAIFRSLCKGSGMPHTLEVDLYSALDAKDNPKLEILTKDLETNTRDALRQLPSLYGDRSILRDAEKVLPDYPEIRSALSDLDRLSRDPEFPVSIDLADLRGYNYHTGIVFSAYVPGQPNAVALGGRYDEVGEAFGRARPASGFSIDLREMARIGSVTMEQGAILAPCSDDENLSFVIEELRNNHEVVIRDLSGNGQLGDESGCDRELALLEGKWQVIMR